MSKDSSSVLATMSAWQLHEVCKDWLPALSGKFNDLLDGKVGSQVFVADKPQLFSLPRPHVFTITTFSAGFGNSLLL